MIHEGLLKELVDAAYDSGYYSGREQDGQPHHVTAIEKRNEAYRKVWSLLAELDGPRADRDAACVTDEKVEKWRELAQREHNAGVLVSVDAETLFALTNEAVPALCDEVKRLRAERDVDRLLAVAERAAREMQEQAASLFGQQWARTEVMQLDARAVARRAAAEQEKP